MRRAIIAIESILIQSNIYVSLGKVILAAYRPIYWRKALDCIDEKSFKNMNRDDIWADIMACYPDVEFDFEDSKNFAIRLRKSVYMMSHGVKAGVKLEIASEEICLAETTTFAIDRLKVQQREAGVRHDLIDAVFALGGEDDLVRLLARVHALQAFVTTPDGTNLLAGYKRAANILKVEEKRDGQTFEFVSEDYEREPEEQVLAVASAKTLFDADEAVKREDFAAAMEALATLRAPVDAFFEKVTINDENKEKRLSRLGLLTRFRDAVHGVADFSKIEG